MADYNFTMKRNTKFFEVQIDPVENYGYFEHVQLGDECGGGLWFQDGELIDYDGVFALRLEVIEAIRDMGYKVDPLFEPEVKA